jgi:ENTH domain.
MTGLFQVAQQCKENIFAIQTLKDFQYCDETKDQGINVREKAKQLVSLLKDDERLRNERARALKAKERFAQAASGFGSEGMVSEVSVIIELLWIQDNWMPQSQDYMTSPLYSIFLQSPFAFTRAL